MSITTMVGGALGKANQNANLRRGAIIHLSVRVWWSLVLVFAISICTAPGAWASTVSPTELTFQTVEGAGNPPSQTVTVFKPNKHNTKWTASGDAGWITVSPGGGTITNSAQISVGVKTTGLAAGTYTATISIQVERSGNSSVPVTLMVVPATTTSLSTTTTPTSTTTVTPTVTTSPSTTTSTSTSTSANSTASLSWNSDTSSNVTGYKVYVGNAPGQYGSSINVGNVTSYVVSNLTFGNTYYFVVTAYGSGGAESPPSNEVSKSIY